MSRSLRTKYGRCRDPHIVECITNKQQSEKPVAIKVLRHLSGPSNNGTVTKEVTDGHVFIEAVFCKLSVEECFNEHSDDGDPQWDSALLLVKKCHYDFVPHRNKENCHFVMVVDQFVLWDLQEGFGRKNTILNSNEDPRVKVKLHEKWQEWRLENNITDDNTVESLTQLLNEMGEEESQSASLLDASDHDVLSPRQQLRSIFRVKDFIIPQGDKVALDAIPEWQTDYKPSPPSSDSFTSPESSNVAMSQTLREDSSSRKAQKTTGLHKRDICENMVPVNIDVAIPVSSGESEYVTCLEETGESSFNLVKQNLSCDDKLPPTQSFTPHDNNILSDLYPETQPFVLTCENTPKELVNNPGNNGISPSQSRKYSSNAASEVSEVLKEKSADELINEEEERLEHLAAEQFYEDKRLQNLTNRIKVTEQGVVSDLPNCKGKRKLSDSGESFIESSPQVQKNKKARQGATFPEQVGFDNPKDENAGVLQRLLGAITLLSPKNLGKNKTSVNNTSRDVVNRSDTTQKSCRELYNVLLPLSKGPNQNTKCADNKEAVCRKTDQNIEKDTSSSDLLTGKHKVDKPPCQSENLRSSQKSTTKYFFRSTRSNTQLHSTDLQERASVDEKANENGEEKESEKTHVSDTQSAIIHSEVSHIDVNSTEIRPNVSNNGCQNSSGRVNHGQQRDDESFQDGQVVSSGEEPLRLESTPVSDQQEKSSASLSGTPRGTPVTFEHAEGDSEERSRHDVMCSGTSSAHRKSLQPSPDCTAPNRDGGSTPQNSLPSYQPLCDRVRHEGQVEECGQDVMQITDRQSTLSGSSVNDDSHQEEIQPVQEPVLTDVGRKLLAMKLPDDLFLEMTNYMCNL